MRLNEVRDLTVNLMSEVSHDVCIEPTLQPVTSELLLNVPQPSQMMAQGWTSLPVGFGEAVLNEPSLM